MPSLLVYDALIDGWPHIAVVHQNRQPVLYVNGAQARRRRLSARFLVTFGGICLSKDRSVRNRSRVASVSFVRMTCH